MRSFLLFAACFGSVIAQASVSTITSTILSTTSSVVGTSTSTLTASSCATSTGSDGQPTVACRNSVVVSPVAVYSQVVVTITTRTVLTIEDSIASSTIAAVQTQTQTQTQIAQTTPTTTPNIASVSSYVYSATSISSVGAVTSGTVRTESTTVASSSTTKHTSVSTTTESASAASSSSSSKSQDSSGTSIGTIIAIVVAILLGLGLIGAAVFFFKRRQGRSRSTTSGLPRIVIDSEKGTSLSLDRTTGAALGKTDMSSETRALTASVPPSPSTPRDGFPDDVHERFEMNTPPPRVYNMDARPSYSPFPRSASRKQ